MKILFLDHAFHQKTRSADFFLAELKQSFEVDVFYIDPDDFLTEWPKFKALPFSEYDLVVVWQLEILSLYVLSEGVPVLVAPMFDGCGDQPAAHWRLLSDVSVVNFSYNLLLRTRDVVKRQLLVQYFPDPELYKPVTFDDGLKVFFWERRPTELKAEHAFRLVRGQFQAMHVHLAPDDPTLKAELPSWLGSYGVSASQWFESKAEFEAALGAHNVAVMPRFTEGIGMFMLECMARGMGGGAPSGPVQNEYICNNMNGLLFDPHSYSAADLSRAAELGRSAREGVVAGRRRWLEQRDERREFVQDAALVEPKTRLSRGVAEQLVRLYFSDMTAYRAAAEGLAADLPPLETAGPVEVAAEPVGRADPFGRARRLASLVPGWDVLKYRVPSSWKIRTAAALAKLMR